MTLLDTLFRQPLRSPAETVAKLVTHLEGLEADLRADLRAKHLDSITRHLQGLKVHLFGSPEHQVTKPKVLEVAREILSTDLLYLLVKHLPSLDFETRKDAVQVFGSAVRIKDASEKAPGAAYVLQHPYILQMLFRGWVGLLPSKLSILLLCTLIDLLQLTARSIHMAVLQLWGAVHLAELRGNDAGLHPGRGPSQVG